MARSDDIRVRILETALRLLQEGGRDAVSTRAVTTALGIQAPTLYRIFGDKQGLLDAVALHGFEAHLDTWEGWQPGTDPVAAMRQGWDVHIAWGVANPELYSIAYGNPRPGRSSPAADAIDAILRTLIQEAASAGRLTLPVEDAVGILRAVGTGVVFTLIAMPPERRDLGLSDRARDVAFSSFLTETPVAQSGHRSATAMQLKRELKDSTVLHHNERALLEDWLDRLAAD